MKKFFFICLVGALALYAQSPQNVRDFDFDLQDTFQAEQVINTTAWDAQINCNKESLIGFLQETNMIALLQQNFFLRSNNVNSRSLLDYPDFLMFRHDADKSGLVINLFYNQTSSCFFTRNSTNICSYLAIAEPDFLNALDNVFTALNNLGVLTVPKQLFFDLLDLFAPFTLQERRMGFMVCGKQKFEQWHAMIQVPWYYLERNHFVTPALQTDIEDTVSEITGIPADQVDAHEQKEFQEAYFISDKLGIGDTRIMIDHAVFKRVGWTMRVGGLVTFPTAFVMTQGIKGSKFCRFNNPPLLDLCAILESGVPNSSLTENNGLAQATEFFLSALDNLDAILLDTPLGNGGHLELGIYMKNKFPVSMYIEQPWSRRLVYRSFMALQYQIPAWEVRSYILPVNSAAFAQHTFNYTDLNPTQTALAVQQDFDFITAQFTERLFPIALNTKVHPGFIFRMTSQLGYEAPKGGFAMGTDTWIRSGEKLTDIQASSAILDRIYSDTAKASFAFQSKVFGSAYFKKIKPGQVWAFGAGGDYTYWSKGIGQDFTLNFFVDVTF